MFKSAQTVLDKTESLLVSKNYQNRYSKWLAKFVGSPFSFLQLGLDELLRPGKAAFIIFWVLLIIVLPVLNYFQFGPEIGRGYFFSVCIFTSVLTIFSLPSTFSFSGVKDSEVNMVADFIETEVIESVEDAVLLEQNFEVVFKHIYSRVKFYQFTIGTLWGFYMYYFNFGIMLWVKSGMPEDSSMIGDQLGILIVTVVITLFAFSFVSAYKRANERLIKTIQFACVQVKYNLAE